MKKRIRQFKETIEIQSSWLVRLKSYRHFNLCLVACAVLVVSFVHIWQRVKVLEQVKEVAVLKKSNKSLIDDLKKANSDISRLTMASRIKTYAEDTLGLKPIRPEKLYTLVPDGVEADKPDELASMLSTIRRVADYLPIIEHNEVRANELKIFNSDSLISVGQRE